MERPIVRVSVQGNDGEVILSADQKVTSTGLPDLVDTLKKVQKDINVKLTEVIESKKSNGVQEDEDDEGMDEEDDEEDAQGTENNVK